MTYDIVPTALALKSLRDNGYKNAAHAVAELMDNAIEAGASRVELICIERSTPVRERWRMQVKEIGVLDNGGGMTPDTLRTALQIGNGTRLDPKNRKGIGRFGMGLPMSSISQAKRVDVWSWQYGVDAAWHTCLDLSEVEEGNSEIPAPTKKPLPEAFRRMGLKTIGETGTLVVWSYLDRYKGGGAETLYANSHKLIGRIYRRQIGSGKLVLRFACLNGDVDICNFERYVPANDPLYLTPNPEFPSPWNTEPLFEVWRVKPVSILHNGHKHKVTLRFSRAKDAARILSTGIDAGNTVYGKHAKGNIGVSLVRADRELDLDQGFVSDHTIATERWWGVEVDFPQELDDVFGVTNNKQAAAHFSDLSKSDLLDGLSTLEAVEKKRADMYDDERSALFEVGYWIREGIAQMRKELVVQTEGRRSPSPVPPTPAAAAAARAHSAEGRASAQTVVREERGYRGESGKDLGKPPEERVADIVRSQTAEGVPQARAEENAENAVTHDLRYNFSYAEVDSPAFFSVKIAGGVLSIILNTGHPAYPQIFEAFAEDTDSLREPELRTRLAGTTNALKLLFQSWARLEDETPEADRQRLRQVRAQWGDIARQFLPED